MDLFHFCEDADYRCDFVAAYVQTNPHGRKVTIGLGRDVSEIRF